MSCFRNLRLLMWKNYLLQLRHPWVTLLEILIPCIFVVMIAMIRIQVEVKDHKNSTEYEGFDILHVPNTTYETIKTYKIYYSPNNDSQYNHIISGTVEALKDRFKERGLHFEAQGFSGEQELVENYLRGNSVTITSSLLCAVVFNTNANFDTKLKFKLRFKSSPINGKGGNVKSWNTQTTFPQFALPGPRQVDDYTGGNPGYYEEGFLAIQHLVSMSVLNVTTKNIFNATLDDFEVIGQRFPYPPYIDDGFLLALQFLFPIILMFSFIYPAVNQTKNLVLEKEKRLKESMKMMGLKDWMHWFAWFLKSLIWLSITVAIITTLLVIKLKDGVGILNKSDGSLVFIFFFLYSIATICFSFMISTIFSKSNVAGVGSGVIFFVSFFPYFTTAQIYLEMTLFHKLSLSLLHNTNMAFGAIVMSMWEGHNVGIQWSNIHNTASPDDTLSLLYVIVMYIVDSFIYLLITWYVSSVFPGEYGIPLKWYFPLTKTYWCGNSCSDLSGEVNGGFELYPKDEIDSQTNKKSNFFEREPKGLNKGIQIKGLSKTFDGGDTYAVKDLSLNTYSGHITALLGHNGAGKTTTMSIITGLFPPSSGTAVVNGFDIRNNIEGIRSSLGICPQFDVLFDELTVEEHLKFYCQLKNVTDPEVVEEEITNMIELLALEDKRLAQVHTLSGGMKRKLSVGMALIGDSKIVILDEPTSGMDVSARRFIWDLLLVMKENRTILLSTHFMEEADVLGDRIAIMANGKLQCCGSPLFLKKKYGAGYHLTITKNNGSKDVSRITQLIQSHIPKAKLDTGAGTELSYSLPNEESSRFEALFGDIEDNQKDLGIDSYGASITTMEEVFLKVGEYAEEGIKAINENQKLNGNQTNGYSSNGHLSVPIDDIDGEIGFQFRNTGIKLVFQQFYGLIVKKVLYSLRNPFLTGAQFILPAFFTISAILLARTVPPLSDSPELSLNLNNFKGTKIPIFNNPTQNDTKLLSDYYSQLLIDPNIAERQHSDSENLTFYANNYLENISNNDISYYSLHRPIGAIFERTSNQTKATALFNNQAFHSPAISMAFIDSAIIKYVLNTSEYILDVSNHPLPRTPDEILIESQFRSQSQFQLAQSLMFAMSFLAASFAVLLVREQSIKGKHLQMVCGVKLYIFWITSYIIDFITYIIPCSLIMLMYYLFDEEALEDSAQESRIFLLFVVHGLAMLPFIYCLSFMFDVPSTAYVRICLYNVIIGIGAFLAVIITELPSLHIQNISKALNSLFSIFLPNFCLGRSLYNLYNNHIGNEICNSDQKYKGLTIQQLCHIPGLENNTMFDAIRMCCKDKCGDNCFPWYEEYLRLETPGIGMQLIWLCFQAVAYWLLIVLIECHVFRRIKYLFAKNGKQTNDSNISERLDEDVIIETERLQKTDINKLVENNALIIRDLTKNYGSFCAVDHISYGVRKGECFGLLGINGAGKTTTFKMITGDETITSGDIFVNGFSVKKNIQTVQQQIGYCPQFDGLLDQLTGRETLTLFSRLRGIREIEIPVRINQISKLLYFDMHINKMVGKYSGGTKRKLSTAVALLGSPSVSFLDEPTTGVDPVARRCLWDALTKKLSEGTSIVLTSHSMEECEALCNRLIIMVNGKICCIGSPQQLKNKFGKGYTVLMKVSNIKGQEELISRQMSRQVSRQMSRQMSKESHKRRSSSDAGVKRVLYNRQTSELIVTQNITDVKEFMAKTFPGSRLKAIHSNLLEYSIDDERLTWSQIFGRIERSKNRINIEDYSIGQTTLEQIFLSFARKQREL